MRDACLHDSSRQVVLRFSAAMMASLAAIVAIDTARFGHLTLPPADPWSCSAPFIVHQVLSGQSRVQRAGLALASIICAIILAQAWNGTDNLIRDIPIAAGVVTVALQVALVAFREEKRQYTSLLALGLLLPVGEGICGIIQHYSTVSADTYDIRCYLIDSSLGLIPTKAVVSALYKFVSIALPSNMAYVLVSLPLAIVPSAHIRNAEDIRWKTALVAFVTAGAVGAVIYLIFPVSGPRYAFGIPFLSIDSVSLLPDPAGLTVAAAAVGTAAPRNGMPSLHAAWAILAFINTAGLPGWGRASALVFAALTMLATLGLGEHYLVDLVVAFPFAVAAQALAKAIVARKAPGFPFWVGSPMVGMWLYALLHRPELFVTVPHLTQAAYVATVTTAVLAQWRVSASAKAPGPRRGR